METSIRKDKQARANASETVGKERLWRAPLLKKRKREQSVK